MVVLALETVTRAGSVAIATDNTVAATAGDPSRTHGERLPGEALDWLTTHGHSIHDVDRFAIVVGPGSFTGLRVGVAAIQGFALATGRPVVPVPTLDALAAGLMFSDRPEPGTVVAACLDGQRGDVFFAAWSINGGGSWPDEHAVAVEPGVGSPESFVSHLASLADRRIVVVGEAAARAATELARLGAALVPDTGPLAGIAARLAAASPERAVAPHALRPIYIRRPDAVLARERADLQIGRATPADLPAVEALQRQTFTNPWSADSIRWELEHTDVARLYVVRTPANQQVIAYCACWMVFDELHVNSLAVDEHRRRQGIATRLLREVLRDSVAQGARSATLEVRQSNEAARRLYEGLGFQVEAVRRDYYQQPREDALILWHRNLAVPDRA